MATSLRQSRYCTKMSKIQFSLIKSAWLLIVEYFIIIREFTLYTILVAPLRSSIRVGISCNSSLVIVIVLIKERSIKVNVLQKFK